MVKSWRFVSGGRPRMQRDLVVMLAAAFNTVLLVGVGVYILI